MSQPTQQPFPFLDLPPELRTKILLHLLQQPSPIPLSSLAATYPHSLLLVSSQIHSEVLPLYFSTNSFALTLRRHNDALAPFLSSPSRNLVRSLKISIERWGANDFFNKSFAPVIEEMILKGGLRRLEVGVREAHARVLERGGSNGMERENWRVLRELLGDPYLEEGRLVSLERVGLEGFGDWNEWKRDVS
jgi:hypothetical protein